jgi:hypothetical protein
MPRLPFDLRFISAVAMAALASVATARAEPSSISPEPENLILGTQAIGGPYKFTDQPYLVEVAEGILEMGSNLIKFNLSPRALEQLQAGEPVEGISSLIEMVERQPAYQRVFAMPFSYYHLWLGTFTGSTWGRDFPAETEEAVYREVYDFTAYLLNRFAGTGKRFYLGNWEGDWLLIGETNPRIDPSPGRVERMRRWLSARQRAVDDAKRAHPRDGVEVYHYVEVNQVWKGINGGVSLTTDVLPHVAVDFVSYSSYDSTNTSDPERNAERLKRALDFIEEKLPPKEGLSGKRVFIGEYAIKARRVEMDRERHESMNRALMRAALEWGVPFMLYWEFYCNELVQQQPGEHEGFWLVDNHGERWPLYYTHAQSLAGLRNALDEARRNGQPIPSEEERRQILLKILDAPPALPPAVGQGGEQQGKRGP